MQTVNFLFSNWFSCSPSKLFIPFQRYYSVPDLNKIFTNPEDGILLLIQTCINSFWQNCTMRLISLPSESVSWQNAFICVWRTITSISSHSGLCAPTAYSLFYQYSSFNCMTATRALSRMTDCGSPFILRGVGWPLRVDCQC